MPSPSFTPTGVSEVLADLYLLSDNELETQATSIRSNLRTWVASNFSLTTTQQTYLTNMDNKFIKLASSLTAFAVENRLTITLGVSGDTGLKLMHLSNDLVGTYDPNNGFSVTGGVYYTEEFTP